MGGTLPLSPSTGVWQSRVRYSRAKSRAKPKRRRQARLELGRRQVQEAPGRAVGEGGMNALAHRAVQAGGIGLSRLANVKMALGG